MNDTTLTAAERILTFADAVRAELADLPAEEVDDLVEGLVGDLTDQAADHDGAIDLGDPVAYAEELRAAAGLPARGPVVDTKTPWRVRLAAMGARVAGRIRSSAFGAWLLDLLIALRPVWWVLRGLVLAALIAIPAGLGPRTILGYGGFPAQVFTWGLFGAIILVSVQWGRDRWLPRSALRHVRTVASVVAVLFLPLLFSPAMFGAYNAVAYPPDSGYTPAPGLQLDGTQVGNIFVYDKDGNLVEGAQLYTERGTPVNLFGADSENLNDGMGRVMGVDGQNSVVPMRDAQGRAVWNVYPLRLRSYEDINAGSHGTIVAPQPPFLRAPDRALTWTPQPTPGATMLPTPTPAPTVATPAPSPTSTPAG
ncbi:hypothetical protein LXM50_08335 [Microbacterium sp. Au-Mic1]|uniref:hypothetical protein n=1 Tax=Microbacterium sp. Au-Mic1 TaxID=2906457 RepID=UPI001E3905E2|nr:hypothetical protein [Microbacterium sp. Au-Mic1]MCE4025979.1 hypothetical protein [Microbacterium sp. Au-Mic1]